MLHPLAAPNTAHAAASRGNQALHLPQKNFSLNAGVAFGEKALQENVQRSSYCCAETDVELIAVPKDVCVQP